LSAMMHLLLSRYWLEDPLLLSHVSVLTYFLAAAVLRRRGFGGASEDGTHFSTTGNFFQAFVGQDLDLRCAICLLRFIRIGCWVGHGLFYFFKVGFGQARD
jgi:hypothetical protein